MNRDSYKKDIKLSEWEFEFQQRNTQPILMNDIWVRAIRDHMGAAYAFDVKSPDYLFTVSNKGYIKSEDKKNIVHKLREKIADPGYLKYIFDRTMTVIDEFDYVVEQNKKKALRETSGNVLAESWRQVESKFLEVVPWFWITWYLSDENMLSERVRLCLEDHKEEVESITSLSAALGILIFPIKEARFQKEQRDFFALVKIARNGPDFESSLAFKEAMQTHLRNYSWLKTFIFLPIEPLTVEELSQRVQEALKSNQLDEYELQELKKKESIETVGKLMEKLKNDRDFIQAVENARELGWLLTASVEQAIYSCSKLLPLFKIYAEKIGIQYKDWVHLTAQEVYDALEGGKKISPNIIKDRISGNAVVLQNNEISFMWGDEAKEFSEWVESGIKTVDTNVREFSGQGVFAGKVIGKVHIALTPQESQTIVTGEILVTSMTSPDYVPAMRKAAAIVTNEGGLLSHAAIMSREFGKPCIVGTKIATMVLKNGDMVEVDATSGTIKKL